MIRTCLIGRDKINWAIDKEFSLTQSMLDFVKLDSIYFSDVIHCIYWEYLLQIPKEFLIGKKIICHLTHDVEIAIKNPKFSQVCRIVSIWIVRSTKSKSQLDKLGLVAHYIPYTFSNKVFYPISEKAKNKYLDDYNLPRNKYLIGSFQRDSEGSNLDKAKWVKGPDIFLDICKELNNERKNIHVILAGPRRHWLIKRLEIEAIPFTYFGQKINIDDIVINNYSQECINILYNMIDLYIVSSRYEGGPQAIIEAAASKCKIISTDVGHARDILQNESIYTSVNNALSIIRNDMETAFLENFIEINYSKVNNMLPFRQKNEWKYAYDLLMDFEKIKFTDLDGFQNILTLSLDFIKYRIKKISK